MGVCGSRRDSPAARCRAVSAGAKTYCQKSPARFPQRLTPNATSALATVTTPPPKRLDWQREPGRSTPTAVREALPLRPRRRGLDAGDCGALSTGASHGCDARTLARDAHELRVTVEARTSDSEVRAAFDRVRRSYHTVRDEVTHSDSRMAQRDLGPDRLLSSGRARGGPVYGPRRARLTHLTSAVMATVEPALWGRCGLARGRGARAVAASRSDIE